MEDPDQVLLLLLGFFTLLSLLLLVLDWLEPGTDPPGLRLRRRLTGSRRHRHHR